MRCSGNISNMAFIGYHNVFTTNAFRISPKNSNKDKSSEKKQPIYYLIIITLCPRNPKISGFTITVAHGCATTKQRTRKKQQLKAKEEEMVRLGYRCRSCGNDRLSATFKIPYPFFKTLKKENKYNSKNLICISCFHENERMVLSRDVRDLAIRKFQKEASCVSIARSMF